MMEFYQKELCAQLKRIADAQERQAKIMEDMAPPPTLTEQLDAFGKLIQR